MLHTLPVLMLAMAMPRHEGKIRKEALSSNVAAGQGAATGPCEQLLKLDTISASCAPRLPLSSWSAFSCTNSSLPCTCIHHSRSDGSCNSDCCQGCMCMYRNPS